MINFKRFVVFAMVSYATVDLSLTTEPAPTYFIKDGGVYRSMGTSSVNKVCAVPIWPMPIPKELAPRTLEGPAPSTSSANFKALINKIRNLTFPAYASNTFEKSEIRLIGVPASRDINSVVLRNPQYFQQINSIFETFQKSQSNFEWVGEGGFGVVGGRDALMGKVPQEVFQDAPLKVDFFGENLHTAGTKVDSNVKAWVLIEQEGNIEIRGECELHYRAQDRAADIRYALFGLEANDQFKLNPETILFSEKTAAA